LNDFIKLRNKSDYLNNHFQIDKEKRSKQQSILTGIKDLDNKLPIRRGVYLLGGLPSIGKSSLAMQFADAFAEQGHHVLFFSLEQTEYDLTVKSINRIMNKESVSEADAMKTYLAFANNITTVTSEQSITVEDIVETVKELLDNQAMKPIIFIDYLQLLHTRKSMGKREEIEEVSRQLVNLSKKYELTLIVLSSLNRANYLSPIDFESYKESGSLEYDADVVIGLQYTLLSDPSFVNISSTDKKRLLISQEKAKDNRQVELVCIKNRFGQIFESCKLDYIPSADVFMEHKQKESAKKATKIL
jgi:replicative DNA helicase